MSNLYIQVDKLGGSQFNWYVLIRERESYMKEEQSVWSKYCLKHN